MASLFNAARIYDRAAAEFFGTKPEGDWVFVVTMHFFMAWWGQTFSTRLSNSSQKLQDDMVKLVDEKSK